MARFLYALTVYAAISVLFIPAQFLLAVVLFYRLSHAAGFACLTASGAVLQYYLASLLVRDLRGLAAPCAIICFSAVLSSVFFLRISSHTGFSSYAFAALPLISSCLLGAGAGLFQTEEENPFKGSRVNMFRID
ncbi:MAG: hypothetical protein WCW52_09195 [Elusimicrobiales bacterium]|jgi:hypothetical protein